LVDDHDVVRQSLMQLLAAETSLEIVGQAANGREAVTLVRNLQPDVVLMDIEMPQMDGIEATRHVLAECPQVRVIGLSLHDHLADAMLAAGAELFVRKDQAPITLLAAICRG
jgi:DNA-binding NarL/FixJ family response regulator